MSDFELPDSLRDAMRVEWHRFLDQVTPIRPGLHGYCLRLTRNIWDAEDLVQDTLVRGFATMGRLHDPVRNPRGYLLRTATNLWIDKTRHRAVQAAAPAEELAPSQPAAPTPGGIRDAGRTLMQRLAPRERAAVILKDVFDLSLEESAEVLETTIGAVKAALHRGRERLQEPEGGAASQRPLPSASLVDRFVELFNAEDKPGLLKLVLDNASVENIGVGHEYGYEAHHGEHSWFNGALGGHPEWPEEWRYESTRAERVLFEDEPIVLIHRARRGREALEIVVRLEEEDGHVSKLRCYGFTPETVRYVGDALGHRARSGPYRYPTREPGVNYGD